MKKKIAEPRKVEVGKRVYNLYCQCNGRDWDIDSNGGTKLISSGFGQKCPICGYFPWFLSEKTRNIVENTKQQVQLRWI